MRRVAFLLRQNPALPVASAGVAALAAATVATLQGPLYEAKALVNYRDPDFQFRLVESWPGEAPAELQRAVAAIDPPPTIDDVRERVSRQNSVADADALSLVAREGDVVEISATSTDATEAADSANAHADSYLATRHRLDRERARRFIPVIGQFRSELPPGSLDEREALSSMLEELRILAGPTTGHEYIEAEAEPPEGSQRLSVGWSSLLGVGAGLMIGIVVALARSSALAPIRSHGGRRPPSATT